jgi:hypothetical protein
MRLDGEVVGVDEWFGSVDVPPSAHQRAASLSVICEHRFIVEQRSAAWVWGVLAEPPHRHELCSSIGARARSAYPQRVRAREVVIDESEWLQLAGVRVTTPLRTTMDYVRFAAEFDAQLALRLLRLSRVSAAECAELIDRRRNLPGKRLARERLRELAAATTTT